MSELVFRPDDRAPLELVFGDDAGAGTAPEYTISGGGSITGLHRASAELDFDINVVRPLLALRRTRWQDGQLASRAVRSSWQDAGKLTNATRVVSEVGLPISRVARSVWQDSKSISRVVRTVQQNGVPITQISRVAFEQARELSLATRTRFQPGRPLAPIIRSGFQQTIRLAPVIRSSFQPGVHLVNAVHASMQPGRPLLRVWRPHFQDGRYPLPGGLPPVPQPPNRDDWCYIPVDPIEMRFQVDGRAPLELVFECERHGPLEPEPGTIVVPVRSVYMTLNTMLLRRVAGDITLPASAFSMSIDADSWTWSWSATVQGAALDLLAPEAGEPVELEVVINGMPYRLLNEDVSRTRRFGESSLSISGRGLAAEIDAPYAPVMNFGNSGSLTAQQIALAALTFNGVGIGWDLEWGLTDWLVPAGAWSHQGTHMSAINAIAAAAGGYVQPHATAKTLRVLPRYPSAPWDWGSVTPDIELPSAPVVVEGIQWIKRPDYNRVYVSGQGQGVLGRVTRTGTGGDLEAPMVVDPLITHADAARQRGICELGNTGSQAMVSLSLPVLAETGIILPGRFVQYVDGATERLGIVRSTAINWQRPRLRQSITLETHVEA